MTDQIGMRVEDLNQSVLRGCDTPGCDHKQHDKLYFHGRCHPKAKVEASYRGGSGVVDIACSICHKLIVRIEVAM